MDQNTVIAIAVVVLGFLSFSYISMQEYMKYKLKKEQIKADALVKTEEIKAKNQLEIERLMQSEPVVGSSTIKNRENVYTEDDVLNERRNRLNERA